MVALFAGIAIPGFCNCVCDISRLVLFLSHFSINGILSRPCNLSALIIIHALFHDRLFWKAIGNTLKFLLLHIPLQLVVSLFLAYLLNQKIRAASFFRASFFMPVIVSGVVVTILWQQLLGYDSGLINRMLLGHWVSTKVGWLVNPDVAIYSIAVMATWKNVGLYVILFLVGLANCSHTIL